MTVLPSGYSDPNLTESQNELRQQIESQLAALIASDHSLAVCDKKPTEIDVESDVEADNKKDGTIKIAWIATIGGELTNTAQAVQAVTVVYDLASGFQWTFKKPDGTSYPVKGITTQERVNP
jgi:hypothetical protein